jgi:hypothetical protein
VSLAESHQAVGWRHCSAICFGRLVVKESCIAIAALIGTGDTGRAATVEGNTTGIIHAVAVANVVWCARRHEVAAAVEVIAAGIEDEFTVDGVAAGSWRHSAVVNISRKG